MRVLYENITHSVKYLDEETTKPFAYPPHLMESFLEKHNHQSTCLSL